MKRFTVFYAGLLYEEYDDPKSLWLYDLPDGAYIYCHRASGRQGDPKWLRTDLTPVLEADVPNALKTWVLILTN